MDIDFIVVGQGLAGSLLSDQLIQGGYTVRIFDYGGANASSIAAGLYNPITGKRWVKTWKADDLFPYLGEYYSRLQMEYRVPFYFPRPLYRLFDSRKEQNDWFSIDQSELASLFVERVVPGPELPGVLHDPYGGLYVRNAGNIQAGILLDAMKNKWMENDTLIRERFDENKLSFVQGKIDYNGLRAGRIIYCNGLASRLSRYFSILPFNPVKGEILAVEIDEAIPFIINKGISVIPEQGTLFKAGSTYEWDNLDPGTSAAARREILTKLKELLRVPVKIVDQVAGIRPATRDRRPFIGWHPRVPNIGIFNGFGSKGVSLIPWLADRFIRHMESGDEPDPEINILRYFN